MLKVLEIESIKITGNRLEVGEWYLWIKPDNNLSISVEVTHKTKNVSWSFQTIQDAVEAIREM